MNTEEQKIAYGISREELAAQGEVSVTVDLNDGRWGHGDGIPVRDFVVDWLKERSLARSIDSASRRDLRESRMLKWTIIASLAAIVAATAAIIEAITLTIR